MSGENHHQGQGPLLLAVTMTATFMGIADGFIVNVAIPAIQRDLHAGFAQVQSVVAAYALCYGVLLVTGGRLGDRYGSRVLFLTGIAIFSVASLLCGLAPNALLLIAARVLQAVGAAAFFPQVLTVLQTQFTGRRRVVAFSVLGVTMGSASIVGQLLGGALIDWDLLGLSWRTVFLVNIPLGVLTLVGAYFFLPSRRPPVVRPVLDIAGAFILTAALILLMFPLLYGEQLGWPWWVLASLVSSIPALALFWRLQAAKTLRQDSPLLDTSLFSQRRFLGGLVVSTVFFAGNAGFFFVLAVQLQFGLGLSPTRTGVAFLPLAVCFTAASLVVQRLSGAGTGRLLEVGYTINLVGVVSLLLVTVGWRGDLPHLALAIPLAIIGVGMGMGLTPLVGRILQHTTPGLEGAASGAVETVIQVASALGVVLLSMAYSAASDTSIGDPVAGQHAPLAFAAALSAYAVLLVVAIVVAPVLRSAAGGAAQPAQAIGHQRSGPAGQVAEKGEGVRR